MPWNDGVFTRPSNSFSEPVEGTLIEPTDAIALFDAYDAAITESGAAYFNVKSYGAVGNGSTVDNDAVAAAVADAVGAADGAVLGASRPGDRVLLGAVAARLQTAVLTDASSVSRDGEELVVTHTIYGGIAEESVRVAGPVALVLDGGPAPAAGGAEPAPVTQVAAIPLGITVVETNASAFEQVDLGAAACVVGIGRGLKAQGDLAMIEALAEASKAEVGCSRPVAEGLNWLGKDRYIGVSGQHIAPELYFAIGISGQLQHMVGVRGAKTIVAINSDPNALVFKDADFCLVGDLYQIVPALTEALK